MTSSPFSLFQAAAIDPKTGRFSPQWQQWLLELFQQVQAGGGGGSYTLPTATASRLGGVKKGSGLAVAVDGTLSTEQVSYLNLLDVPASFTPASHNQAISTITGLQNELDTLSSASSGDLVKLSTITLSTDQASVSFTNISQDYTNLRIRYIARGTEAAYGVDVKLVINGDNGANYYRTYFYVHGGYGGGSSADLNVGFISAASNASGAAAVGVIDIPFYANATFWKEIQASDASALDNYSSKSEISITAGQWRSTSAVTSMTLSPVSGNFKAGSSFVLYGEK